MPLDGRAETVQEQLHHLVTQGVNLLDQGIVIVSPRLFVLLPLALGLVMSRVARYSRYMDLFLLLFPVVSSMGTTFTTKDSLTMSPG